MRPDAVEHLAAAYREKGRSAYADAVIANRHQDFFPAECLAAVNMVLVELAAELVTGQAERALMDEFPSSHAARLQFLTEISDEEFGELRGAGLLDDLEP